jgi:hypothetical protein
LKQQKFVLADLSRDKSARACLPDGRRVAPAQAATGRLDGFVCCTTSLA